MVFPSFDDLQEVIDNDEMVGFCLACGYQQDCVEPDARRYQCDECGETRVYGAEELVIMGNYK